MPINNRNRFGQKFDFTGFECDKGRPFAKRNGGVEKRRNNERAR